MENILLIVLLIFSTIGTANAELISVEIKGFRNRSGQASCALFENEDGFPDDYTKASKKILAEIGPDLSATCSFETFKINTAAIAVLHDEDLDGNMDTSLIGIPREGWGVSNNASAQMFGPPLYRDAEFSPASVSRVSIMMNY